MLILEHVNATPSERSCSTTPASSAFATAPSAPLAEEHRALVCGMNRAFLEGVVEGLGAEGLEARPEFEPGHCCVTVSIGPEGS